MFFPIDVLRAELRQNISELTAAVLLIPVAMTFQNLAQMMVRSTVDFIGLIFAFFVLTALLVLWFTNVVVLSLCVACLQRLDWRGQLVTICMVPVFIVAVLGVSAVIDPQNMSLFASTLEQDIFQCGLLAFVIPPLLMRIFVNWEGYSRLFDVLDVGLLIDLVIVIYVIVILFPPTTLTLFDQPSFPSSFL